MSNDNLFLAPDGQKSSDVIRNETVGVKLDKGYSLQRFTIDATVTNYNYRNNSYLDYTGKNLNAGWAWSLSPRLYGNFTASRVDALNSFIDFIPTTASQRRNIRTTQIDRLDAEWEMLGPWHLIGSGTRYSQHNSQTFIQDDSYWARVGEAGVKYVSSAKNSVSLVRRWTSGNFARAPDPTTEMESSFTQTDDEIRVLWQPTVKTSVNTRLAYIERRSDQFAVRDYSGTVGSVDVNWSATDKLNLIASIRRDLNPFQNISSDTTSFSSYYASNMYTLTPTWAITEKTKLGLRYSVEQRDYRGTIVDGSPMRNDRLHYFGATAEWKPRKSVTVNLNYLHQTRDSNLPDLNFSANTLFLSALLNF